MKRKLEGKELALAVKVLDSKKQEKEWIEYQLEYYKLMLDKGLMMNYRKNVRDFTAQKHEFESETRMIDETIRVLSVQIRDGVEIKEIKESKGGKK